MDYAGTEEMGATMDAWDAQDTARPLPFRSYQQFQPSQQQQQPALLLSGRRIPQPRRRGAAQTASDTQVPTTLERLMEAAPVHLNPADGSALRSLPLRRSSGMDVTTSASHPAATSAVKPGGRSAEETCGVVGRQPRPSRSPRGTPPLTFRGKATLEAPLADMKQSSSSSCDMTGNRPENSSGDDDRGVGGGVRAGRAGGPASSSTPQLRSTDTPEMVDETPVYEGRPVYYDTLPKSDLPNDPLLKDVLAALQEDNASRMKGADSQAMAVDELSSAGGGKEAAATTATQRQSCSPGERRQYEEVGQNHSQRRRSQRRRPPPPSSSLHAQARHVTSVSSSQHTSTFSQENLLAGLDEEDEEDRMNLHNRATVDIVLPVPLDSLMKTLEYTQHSKRLRRKRFPIVIDVTGAVWIIGSHLWSTMMARVLAQRGYVVFCPDYRNFPQTTMEGMTLDVSDAIAWVLNNAERYNGDLNNVTLIGQSAGAHLTMMSLLSQAQLSAYRSNTLSGMYENVPPPSDVAYNVPRYNPRESIHRYVGLSGMYNIEGLVDHFQQEGLNTPVLHQIAGGRDQLARYSIHAYFDDRRNGDTGEVLPQNIFDYFPQRMFFVHGDADRSAPVTESASLVAMLRRAQTRYTLRRSEHNEEARRHALRSRRLLPGALASSGGGVGLNNDDDGSTGLLGAGGRRSSPAQRSAGEEDGSRCCGSAATRAFNDSAALGSHRHGGGGNDDTGAGGDEGTGYNAPRRPHVCDYADNAAAGGGGGGGGQSVLMEDASTRHGFFYGGGGPSAPTQQPSSSPPPLQHVQPPPTIVSPIVPPSRQDHPKPAVELEFIVIPNGRHSDAFVDECIAAGRSCCVDFLCDYESAVDFPTSSFTNSVGFDAEAESLCGSLQASSSAAYRSAEHIPAWMTQSPEECAMPDGILPLAVPTEQRSLPLRLCTLICPF
jgi:acetyl esterase/lipase